MAITPSCSNCRRRAIARMAAIPGWLDTCQRPPLAVRTPRALRTAAIPRKVRHSGCRAARSGISSPDEQGLRARPADVPFLLIIATFAKAASLIFAYFIGSLSVSCYLPVRSLRIQQRLPADPDRRKSCPFAGGRQDTPERGERDWEKLMAYVLAGFTDAGESQCERQSFSDSFWSARPRMSR